MGVAPRVGISSCLLGNAVRHDGGHKLDRWLRDALGARVAWVPVCPEVECEGLRGFVFKSRSPSCGLRRLEVRAGGGAGPSAEGVGIFARAFIERFPQPPVEDEARLADPAARELFVERLFACPRRERG